MCTFLNIPRWYETATAIEFHGSTLSADLKRPDGTHARSSIDFNKHLSLKDSFFLWGKGGGIASQAKSLEWESPSTLIVTLADSNVVKATGKIDLTWILEDHDGKFRLRQELARRCLASARGFGLENNHILTAWVFDETTGDERKSTLDLDYCLQRGAWDHNYWEPARAPKNLKSPYRDELEVINNGWKWSEEYKEENKSIDVSGSILHIRVERWFKTYDSVLNLDDFVRRTRNGHIEWIHPPHKAMIPEWLETLGGIYSAMSKTPSSALETIIELAKDHLLGDIKASDGNVHKEWMRGTYVDEGVLIRHGS